MTNIDGIFFTYCLTELSSVTLYNSRLQNSNFKKILLFSGTFVHLLKDTKYLGIKNVLSKTNSVIF